MFQNFTNREWPNLDIDQVDAALRELAKLIQVIAGVNNARINVRRGFGWHAGSYAFFVRCVNSL